jgi:hypothetical protein
MTEDDVLTALGNLIAVTTGWNDQATEQYAHELIGLDDGEVLLEACRAIGRTWNESRRPPLADIRTMYRRLAERKQQQEAMTRRALQGGYMPPAQGVKVARDAYVAECRKQNREPNLTYFDQIMRKVTQ